MNNNEMTRHEYWAEVESLAKSITEECFYEFAKETQAEIIEDNLLDEFREALDTRIWETIDGHQWVIYTAYNFDVMRFSPNDDYAIENWGKESIVNDSGLNTAAIAFGALYADVIEHSDFGVVEPVEA